MSILLMKMKLGLPLANMFLNNSGSLSVILTHLRLSPTSVSVAL